MREDELARKRLEFIERQQNRLTSAVLEAQEALVFAVVESAELAIKNPATLTKVFNKFLDKEMLGLVEQFIGDLLRLSFENDNYFQAITGKDYKPVKNIADSYLRQRLGIDSSGKTQANGFIDLFIKDTSIQQKVKTFAYKMQRSGKGLVEFNKGAKELIRGDNLLQKHFKTYAFDTYQQADATIQNIYAKELKLQAALYSGVAVKDSRSFCVKRKGKIFLRDEIKAWEKLPAWNGRNDNYDAFIDRGGHGCIDGFNYLTNKMALRRREDLEEINGILVVKT